MNPANTWANEISKRPPHLQVMPMAKKLTAKQIESRAIVAAVISATRSTQPEKMK